MKIVIPRANSPRSTDGEGFFEQQIAFRASDFHPPFPDC